jgi:hypothetical protein
MITVSGLLALLGSAVPPAVLAQSEHQVVQPAALVSTIREPLDVVLLQDETGSMYDDISAVQALAPQIWDGLSTVSSGGFRMSVVGFRDVAQSSWGETNDWIYRRYTDFTDQRSRFVAATWGLSASGGLDVAEGQLPALGYLLDPAAPCLDSNGDGDCSDANDTRAIQQPSFRSGARRIILLATDAPFHSPTIDLGYPGPTFERVADLLIASNTIVIGLVPGGSGQLPDVDRLAQATGGSTQSTGASGREVVSAILAAFEGLQPTDPAQSSVLATPAILPADGDSRSTLTITLRDQNNQPLVGRRIWLYSQRGALDMVEQPALLTNTEGWTTGWIASFTPGDTTITAIVLDDGVMLAPAVVTFTNTIVPDQQLQAAIQQLSSTSTQQLQALVPVATQARDDGNFFFGKVGIDTFKLMSGLVFGFLSVAGDLSTGLTAAQATAGIAYPAYGSNSWDAIILRFKAVHPDAGRLFNGTFREAAQANDFSNMTLTILRGGMQYYAAGFRKEAIEKIASDQIESIVRELLNSPQALSQMSAQVINDIGALQTSIQEQRTTAIGAIPPIDQATQLRYAADLQRRSQAATMLAAAQYHHVQMLGNLRGAHESTNKDGWAAFVLKFGARLMAQATFDGYGAAAVNGFLVSFEGYLNAKKLEASTQGALAAFSILHGLPNTIRQIGSNAMIGIGRVQTGELPNTATGRILAVRHYSQGQGAGLFWWEDSSYSEVDVINDGNSSATFLANTQYQYTNTLFLFLPWALIPMVATETVVVEPQQQATIRVYYKRGSSSGSPDRDSMIWLDVAAANSTGLFAIDHRTTTWQPQRIDANGVVRNGVISTTSYPMPVDLYLQIDPADRPSTLQVYASNPFTQTIDMLIIQPLPNDARVTETDGIVQNGSVVWNIRILARDIAARSMLFVVGGEPGAPVVLAPAEVRFVAPGDTNATRLNIAAAPAQRAWPVEVSMHFTPAMIGATTPIQLQLKNIGNAAIDTTLEVVYRFEGTETARQQQAVLLSQAESQILSLQPPALNRPGTYLVEVYLGTGANRQRVALGEYRVDGYLMQLPLVVR